MFFALVFGPLEGCRSFLTACRFVLPERFPIRIPRRPLPPRWNRYRLQLRSRPEAPRAALLLRPARIHSWVNVPALVKAQAFEVQPGRVG